MPDTILVTGGTGFVGSAVVAALRAQGRNVISLGRSDGDITAAATLEPYRRNGVTSVVHCAGRTFVPDSWNDPAGFMTANVTGTTQVLEFCRTTGVRLTHISAYIYGRPDSLPIGEDAPLRPNNPYALSKYLAEQACRFYATHHSVPVTILRPFNIYGPGQPEKFLIPTILSQLRGQSIELLDLKPRRDYVFLADLVDATLRAEALVAPGCRVLNIGSGTSHSVAQIIAEAQSAAGTALRVVSRDVARNNEIADVVADIAAAARMLGWMPRYNLSEGLRLCWQAVNSRQVPNDNFEVSMESAMVAAPWSSVP